MDTAMAMGREGVYHPTMNALVVPNQSDWNSNDLAITNPTT